ncbi:hypothetical protein MTR_2g037820 [Medicago truncatula]|uniref:Uncharacterized protein n=1 Tax=Medicago truncatula TaxID=3880 RepID=Q2HUL9_MEDTR|nr:hypothetical protein MtrDRAFT_AC149130g38v2 [Medicago truncatula]AES65301.2 hypothetical protein MTR_2g037820 [Medicago truncatula]
MVSEQTSPVRCGSGMNQAEVGGHVTPTADESKGVVAGAQGTTMSSSQQFINEPNQIGMRGIPRPCRYGTAWLKEDLYELFGTTYINKMHLLFGSTFHKNSTVKRV